MRLFSARFFRRVNPFIALSPLLVRTTSVDHLPCLAGPYEYASADHLATPEIMDYPVMPDMLRMQVPRHTVPAANVRILKDVIYSAQSLRNEKNMLLTQGRKLIRESSNTMRGGGNFDSRVCFRRVSATENGIVFPFRGVSNNFYHTLIDNVPSPDGA